MNLFPKYIFKEYIKETPYKKFTTCTYHLIMRFLNKKLYREKSLNKNRPKIINKNKTNLPCFCSHLNRFFVYDRSLVEL